MQSLRSLVASGAVLLAAATAWAQDYTVTTATGLYESRPAAAPQVLFMQGGAEAVTYVQLPFQFAYYGSVFDSITVTSGGYLVPGSAPFAVKGLLYNHTNHGQDPSTFGFPFTPGGLPPEPGCQNVDGLISPWWTYMYVSAAYVWTAGAAPNRHVVVSWEQISPSGGGTYTAQAHLYERTGRVVFAYGPRTNGSQPPKHVCGLDSPTDARYTAPLGAGNQNLGLPQTDFIFDPVRAICSGRLTYDVIVADATGIGHSTIADRPMSGVTIELRNGAGTVLFETTPAADGSFALDGAAVLPGWSGSVVAVARNAACVVRPSASAAATSWNVAGPVSFSSDQSLGTRKLDVNSDPLGDLRAQFHVARVCLSVREWAVARTLDPIPRIDVLVDATNSAVSSFTPAGSASVARIAARSAVDPDVWDDSVITRTYARHVLQSISAAAIGTFDPRFDARTDAGRAFAEAFTCWLWAAISDTTSLIDAQDSTAASVTDLESPVLASAPGPDVAGSVAGALFDLLDPANETADRVDGTPTADRVMRVADTLTTAPTAASFANAWIAAGHDGPGLMRIFIDAKLLPDDPLEPNDTPDEAAPLGPPGFIRGGLSLNRHNEDWFSVTLAGTTVLAADATFVAATAVTVELRDAGGSLIAVGVARPYGAGETHHIAPRELSAGTYRIGVRPLDGSILTGYSLQAYVPLSMANVPMKDWTIDRPYDADLGVRGGIAPFAFTAIPNAVPPGLRLDAQVLRVAGQPSQSGEFTAAIELVDAGIPPSSVFIQQPVTIHDALSIELAEFVGFPAGRTIDTALVTLGGTPPYDYRVTGGSLPAGLAIDSAEPRFHGTAQPGSSQFVLGGSDVAGSAVDVPTRAVIAIELAGKNVPSDLATGDDACGWWFDGVAGSTVAFSAKTSKGRGKRSLTGAVLAPDRSLVSGAVFKSKSGSLSFAKLVCPASGRYYVIAASADGAATQLLGTARIAPPKKGRQTLTEFGRSDTTIITLGALAGAKLTLKFSGDKKAGLTAKVVSLTDPAGAQLPFASLVTASALGGTLAADLPIAGTWTIVLGADSVDGTPGKLTASWKIAQPKGAGFVAQD